MTKIKLSKGDLDRVTIYGPSGSGKSTLAKNLGEILEIDFIHLDDLFWYPNWREPTREFFRKVVEKELEREKWIIDGNYSRVRDMILPKATFAIILDLPLYVILWRIFARTIARNTWFKFHKSTHLPKRIEESNTAEKPILAIYELSMFSIKHKLFKKKGIIQEVQSELGEGRYIVCRSMNEVNYLIEKIKKMKSQEKP